MSAGMGLLLMWVLIIFTIGYLFILCKISDSTDRRLDSIIVELKKLNNKEE